MKKIGIQMGLLMGVTLSFCLSLTGLVSAGKFSVPALLINFAVSFVISMIIGVLVPMQRVGNAVIAKAGLEPRTMKARLLESLISDLIYTPVITFCMVFIAYKQAVSHGAKIPFPPMLIKSMIISLIVGYILIFIFQPLFLKIIMKKNGVGGPPAGGPPPFNGNGPRE